MNNLINRQIVNVHGYYDIATNECLFIGGFKLNEQKEYKYFIIYHEDGMLKEEWFDNKDKRYDKENQIEENYKKTKPKGI